MCISTPFWCPMSVWFVRLCLPPAALLKSILVAWNSLVCLYLLSSHETKLTCVCSLIAPLRTWVQRYTRNSGLCAMLKLIHTYMCVVILLGNWCNWWLGMLLVQTTSSYLWCGLSWNVSLVRTTFLEVHQFHAKTETNRRPLVKLSLGCLQTTKDSRSRLWEVDLQVLF